LAPKDEAKHLTPVDDEARQECDRRYRATEHNSRPARSIGKFNEELPHVMARQDRFDRISARF
jgi:hypothetical protein